MHDCMWSSTINQDNGTVFRQSCTLRIAGFRRLCWGRTPACSLYLCVFATRSSSSPPLHFFKCFAGSFRLALYINKKPWESCDSQGLDKLQSMIRLYLFPGSPLWKSDVPRTILVGYAGTNAAKAVSSDQLACCFSMLQVKFIIVSLFSPG